MRSEKVLQTTGRGFGSGLPALNEFLAERCGEYELGEFHLHKGLIEPENSLLGHFGSNVVRGSYTAAGVFENIGM